MQRLEVSGAVQLIYGSLGVKQLIHPYQNGESYSLSTVPLHDCQIYVS